MRDNHLRAGPGGPAIPSLPDWTRKLLIGMFGLYVFELMVRATGLPVGRLTWSPWSQGFEIWQPFTRFFVQGSDVFDVLLTFLVAFFLLPPLDSTFRREQLVRAAAACALGATLVPLGLDIVGLGRGAAYGWSPLISIGALCLFGLAHPQAQVLLFFVLPVSAPVFVWGSLGLSILLLLAAFGSPYQSTMHAAQYLGAWLGAWGWWQTMGPGGHRRQLRREAASVRSELRRFEVLQGGKQDDDLVH